MIKKAALFFLIVCLAAGMNACKKGDKNGGKSATPQPGEFQACFEFLKDAEDAMYGSLQDGPGFEAVKSPEDLCAFMGPDKGGDPEQCRGEVKKMADSACKPGSLKFKVVDNMSFEISAKTPSGACCLCATEEGTNPVKEAQCNANCPCDHRASK